LLEESSIKRDGLLVKKEELRQLIKQKMASLDPSKYKRAKEKIFWFFPSQIKSYKNVLSFSNMENELPTGELNLLLAKENRLFLPKVQGPDLLIYRVTDPLTQLEKHPFGFYEPKVTLCEQVSPDLLHAILVPGVAFDNNCNRLGHGKGYYDRFLKQVNHCKTIGMAFSDQLHDPIPMADHDMPVNCVYLF
jgi:5-formyltetrahydrofolate cyclo-ligase